MNRNLSVSEWYGSLRLAMVRRHVGTMELARRTGLSGNCVSHLRTGEGYPTLPTAKVIAEALDWPGLLDIVIRERTKTCGGCGRVFVDQGSHRKAIYCSTRCCHRERARRDAGQNARLAITDRLRWQEAREAVAAYCMGGPGHPVGCSDDGRCWDATCPLRPCSPLPLASQKERVA